MTLAERKALYESNHSVKEDIESQENNLTPPQSELDMGIASMLTSAIKDEWEAIDTYNSILATLVNKDCPAEINKIISDIVSEELIHVGQLEKALELVATNTLLIQTGEMEAEEQIQADKTE